MVQALYDGNFFETTRVFPTQGIGTDAGWHYSYPVMEVRAPPNLSCAFPAVALLLSTDMQMAACRGQKRACHREPPAAPIFLRLSLMLGMHRSACISRYTAPQGPTRLHSLAHPNSTRLAPWIRCHGHCVRERR